MSELHRFNVEKNSTSENGYVENLKIQAEAEDKNGIKRPIFKIANREVAFRNRNEIVEFSDRDVCVMGDTKPTDDLKGYNYEEMSRYKSENNNDNDEKLLIIDNTPLGIVEAAEKITEDEDRKDYFIHIIDLMKKGDYAKPEVQEILDNILASISINDEGEENKYFNFDGYALTLAAITGDLDANSILNFKRERLREVSAEKKDKISEEKKENFEPDKPFMDLKDMALVHTTSHDIVRNENGEIVLKSAGEYRQDIPRSTLHFTVNSRVESNMGGQWEAEGSKMIVCNMENIVSENKKLPSVLYGVDTYYSLSPGEGVTLPGASVVEGVKETSDGSLLEQTENGDVQYLLRDDYSEDQINNVIEMCKEFELSENYVDKYGVNKALQEIALRKALSFQKIDTSNMDTPSHAGHYMSSEHIDNKIRNTAHKYGIRTGIHANHVESWAETEYSRVLASGDSYGSVMVGAISHPKIETFRDSNLGIEMRRQLIVDGILPGRELSHKENEFEDLFGVDNIV